jgi:TrmH family RNA methyltransferase
LSGAATNDGPAVVLVRPQGERNVGAVARAMNNMGLERLLLVEPAVAVGGEGRAMAMRSEHILDAAVRVDSLAEAVAPFRRVVGTTSGRERSTDRPVWNARELADRLAADAAAATGDEAAATTALVFGPETSGLTNDELALCGWLVTIPCAPARPTLNLSQAVLLVAYELRMAALVSMAGLASNDVPAPTPATVQPPQGLELPAPATPAPVEQVSGLFEQAEAVLTEVGFARDGSFEGVLRDLRALASRSGLSEREVAILRGVCRRIRHALRRAP